MQTLTKIVTVVMALAPFTGICQQGNYIIKGKLAHLKAPAKVYLVEAAGLSVIDSTTVKNGEYEFRGTVKAPENTVVFLNKDNSGFNKQLRDGKRFFLEAGTITITSTKETLSLSKVAGTPNNDAANAYSMMLSAAARPLDKKVAALKKSVSPEQQKEESFLMEMAALEKEKIDTLIKYVSGFITAHPNSLVSVTSLGELADFLDYEAVNSFYQAFSKELRESREGKIFSGKLDLLRKVSLGSVAPDLSIPDTAGNPVKLSSFRGKYLLVDVWASWCGPCRKENPNHVRTYQKFKDKNFTIVGVSIDDNKKSWLNAIQKDGMPWTQTSDLKGWGGEIVSVYGLGSLPQNYLLDPNGVIIAKNLQGKDLSDRLEAIFGAK